MCNPLAKNSLQGGKARDFFNVYRYLYHNRNSSGCYIARAVPNR